MLIIAFIKLLCKSFNWKDIISINAFFILICLICIAIAESSKSFTIHLKPTIICFIHHLKKTLFLFEKMLDLNLLLFREPCIILRQWSNTSSQIQIWNWWLFTIYTYQESWYKVSVECRILNFIFSIKCYDFNIFSITIARISFLKVIFDIVSNKLHKRKIFQ